jgi:hypothetical protein
MKHDYMTDRNWKLDEDQATPPQNKGFNKIIYSLLTLLIIAALGLFTWHHYKKRHEEMLAAEAIIQTAPVSSPEMPVSTGNSASPAAATTSVSTAPSTPVHS